MLGQATPSRGSSARLLLTMEERTWGRGWGSRRVGEWRKVVGCGWRRFLLKIQTHYTTSKQYVDMWCELSSDWIGNKSLLVREGRCQLLISLSLICGSTATNSHIQLLYIVYYIYIVYVVVYPLLAVGYRLVDWLQENMKISKWTQGSTCCSAVRSIDAQLAGGGAPAWRWSLTNWRFAGLSSGHSA